MDKFTLPKLSHNLEDKFKIDHSPFLLDPGPIIVYDPNKDPNTLPMIIHKQTWMLMLLQPTSFALVNSCCTFCQVPKKKNATEKNARE